MANEPASVSPVPLIAAVCAGVVALGALGWSAAIQDRTKKLEKRLEVAETRLAELNPKFKPAETTKKKSHPATRPATTAAATKPAP